MIGSRTGRSFMREVFCKNMSAVAMSSLIIGATIGVTLSGDVSGATTPKQINCYRVTSNHLRTHRFNNVCPKGWTNNKAVAMKGVFVPPKLHGAKIVFADGSQPDVSDAELYVMTKILNSWGAKASIINVTSDSVAVLEVVSGAANIAYIATNGTIDSGLVSFAPALPRVDYEVVAPSKYTTLQSLAGQTVGYSKPAGLEAEMWAIALKSVGLTPTSVQYEIAGGQSARITALIIGDIQGAMLDTVHYQELLATPGGQGFNAVTTMAKVAPELEDSTMSATGGWLSSNQKLATAVNEAWLEAAKLFQTSSSTWIKDAFTYSNQPGGADETMADAQLQYKIYSTDQEYLDQPSMFSSALATYNESIANSVGALPTNGAPPLNVWFTATYWNNALKALNIK